MTTAAKREKLHDFVNSADDEQIKAIFIKIEDFIIAKSEESKALVKTKKMNVMKLASNDPLFLIDLKEVNDDFANCS